MASISSPVGLDRGLTWILRECMYENILRSHHRMSLQNPINTHFQLDFQGPPKNGTPWAPYYSHTTPIRIPEDMGIVWDWSGYSYESHIAAKWAMKKSWLFGVYMGFYYPCSYIGIIIDLCKDPDPYETTSCSWKVRDPGFFSWLKWALDPVISRGP